MVRRGAGGVLLFAVLCAGVPVFAAEEPTERSLRGVIVDPSMYLREGKSGQAEAPQTLEAIDAGQSPALLEDGTGHLYLILSETPFEDPAGLVYDYLNESVGVTGKVYERGGMRGIVVTAVEGPEEPDGDGEEPAE